MKFLQHSIICVHCVSQCNPEQSDNPTSIEFCSVQSLSDLVVGGREERFSRDPLPVFSAGGFCEHFWHGQGRPLFDIVYSVFPLPTTASPILQGALKDGFGEAVVTCDMPEPCMFPSLGSCQKRFLWTHSEFDLALHPVISLVLQIGLSSPTPYRLCPLC